MLYQFGRLVDEVKPHIVSMENVPELENEKVFSDFVGTLTRLGYNVTYKVVNAADYGVPQRRKKTITFGIKEKKISFIQPTHQQPVTVREAIGNLATDWSRENNAIDRLHITSSLSALNLQRIQHSMPGGKLA